MARVRAEAERPKALLPRLPGATENASLPPVAMLPAAPAVWIPGPLKSRLERLNTLLQTAREKNESSPRIPRFLRRFFRKQGGYNRAVVESIAALSKTSDDLARRMGEIITCLGQFNSWLLALHEQSDSDAIWIKSAAPGVGRIAAQESQLRYLQRELAAAVMADYSKREELDRRISFVEQQRDELIGRIDEGETQFRERLAALKEQADAADALAGEFRERANQL